MVHYGQLVPRGMFGWVGYGGSGGGSGVLGGYAPSTVFLWDPEREVGFVYIPTYLAWWVAGHGDLVRYDTRYDREKQRATNLLCRLYGCLDDIAP